MACFLSYLDAATIRRFSFFNDVFLASPAPIILYIGCGQLTGWSKNWQGRGGQTAGAGKGR